MSTNLETILKEEVLRLENVITILRDCLLAAGLSVDIVAQIEDEAYNKEI